MLRLDAVSKRFHGKPALGGLTLAIKPGEIFALLGPSGAGKTTTLSCIAGLTLPNSGSITLGGHNITKTSPMRRDVAMVFEGFNLLPVLSVRDNIAFPLRSPTYREPETEIDTRVRAVAGDLRIDHLLDRDVETLSGGERQRVAIARAIVRRPALYLLDEPLSALDLKLREELRVELKTLHEAHGSTILYATHDYHGAVAIADRIGILDQGKLYQTGTVDELFADPRHACVGKLMGSPAMAQFAAFIDNDGEWLGINDTELRLPLTPAQRNKARGACLAGVWPEDIALSLQPQPGYFPATLYATDFRGVDKAVQVDVGPHYFRKVVGIDFAGRQGDRCWFRIDPERLFLFTPDGERL